MKVGAEGKELGEEEESLAVAGGRPREEDEEGLAVGGEDLEGEGEPAVGSGGPREVGGRVLASAPPSCLYQLKVLVKEELGCY